MPNSCWSDHQHGCQAFLPPTGGPLHTPRPKPFHSLHHQPWRGWVCTWNAASGWLYGRQRRYAGQVTTAQAELPTICAWSTGTHSPEQRREECSPGPQGPCTLLTGPCYRKHTLPACTLKHGKHPHLVNKWAHEGTCGTCEQNELMRTSPKDAVLCLAPSTQHYKWAAIQCVPAFQENKTDLPLVNCNLLKWFFLLSFGSNQLRRPDTVNSCLWHWKALVGSKKPCQSGGEEWLNQQQRTPGLLNINHQLKQQGNEFYVAILGYKAREEFNLKKWLFEMERGD